MNAVIHREIEVTFVNILTNVQCKETSKWVRSIFEVQFNNLTDSLEYLKS